MAVDFARDRPGSRIVVVHGREVDLTVGGGPMAAGLVVPDLQDAHPPIDAGIVAMLDEAVERIAAAGVAASSSFQAKATATALLGVAETESADIIVVASHGTGGIRRVLLGSTPYKLVHHSSVPLVVVPHRH